MRVNIVLLSVVILLLIGCGDDDTTPVTDPDASYFPLSEGNFWTYDKSYFKSNGEIYSTSNVYWKTDSCCYYINKLELTPDSVNLGQDFLVKDDDNWIYSGGTYPYLGLEYVDKPSDSLYLVASRGGNVPYKHYIYGGLEVLNTAFGRRNCIRTLSIYEYQNQRIEQYRWFCQGIGEYKSENYKIEILKTGEDGASYLTSTELIDYNVSD